MGTDGTDDATDPAIERVRRELALLGRDAASAPEVPAEVTARISAALRKAGRPAHSVPRPPVRRAPLIGLVIGLLAVLTGVVVGAAMLMRSPSPRFPPGPTAHSITVLRPADAFALTASEVTALLSTAPDYGPLSDPRRRAACLEGLGYPGTTPVLGARPLSGSGVVLVLPADDARMVTAVLVRPDCNAAHSGLQADTVVARP